MSKKPTIHFVTYTHWDPTFVTQLSRNFVLRVLEAFPCRVQPTG